MTNTLFMLFVTIPVFLLFIGGIVYLFVLLCRALKKYIHSSESRKEQAAVKKSLGEVLKNHRTKNKMTQEFVAETIGVSRQSVSKWEQGITDPSTSILLVILAIIVAIGNFSTGRSITYFASVVSVCGTLVFLVIDIYRIKKNKRG